MLVIVFIKKMPFFSGKNAFLFSAFCDLDSCLCSLLHVIYIWQILLFKAIHNKIK